MNTSSKSIPDSNEFTGKRVLVTGGTKGIGEDTMNKEMTSRYTRGKPRDMSVASVSISTPHKRRAATLSGRLPDGPMHAK